jgi:hypothetical protein
VWPGDWLCQRLPLGHPWLTVAPHRATGNQANWRSPDPPSRHLPLVMVGAADVSLLARKSPGHLSPEWPGDYSPSGRAHPVLPTTKGRHLLTCAHVPKKIRETQKQAPSGTERPGLLFLSLCDPDWRTAHQRDGHLALKRAGETRRPWILWDGGATPACSTAICQRRDLFAWANRVIVRAAWASHLTTPQ